METEISNESKTKFLIDFYFKIESKNPELAGNLTNIRNRFVLFEYLRIVDEITSYIRKKSTSHDYTLLDWGCGIGHMMYLFKDKKINVMGFELTNDLYDKKNDTWQVLLKETNLLPKVTYDSHPVTMPYKSESLDSVMSIGVLEHVQYPEKSIVEVERILKPGGLFFIYELPNHYSYGEWLRKKLKKGHHPLKFKRHEIIELLEKNNFTVLKSRYASFLPRRMKNWKNLVWLVQKFAPFFEVVDFILSNLFPLNRLCQNLEIIAEKKPTKRLH